MRVNCARSTAGGEKDVTRHKSSLRPRTSHAKENVNTMFFFFHANSLVVYHSLFRFSERITCTIVKIWSEFLMQPLIL
jgi:hypothetical protein